jgi:hypothetical protein
MQKRLSFSRELKLTDFLLKRQLTEEKERKGLTKNFFGFPFLLTPLPPLPPHILLIHLLIHLSHPPSLFPPYSSQWFFFLLLSQQMK